MTKDSTKLVFDIKIMTKNSLIFCAYLLRENEISVTLAHASKTMSIEEAHMMTRHHDEEQKQKMTLELGWPLKKGLMMSYEAV